MHLLDPPSVYCNNWFTLMLLARFWQDSKASHGSKKTPLCLWDRLYTMQTHRRRLRMWFVFILPALLWDKGLVVFITPFPLLSTGHPQTLRTLLQNGWIYTVVQGSFQARGKAHGHSWGPSSQSCFPAEPPPTAAPTHSQSISWASTMRQALDQALRLGRLHTTATHNWCFLRGSQLQGGRWTNTLMNHIQGLCEHSAFRTERRELKSTAERFRGGDHGSWPWRLSGWKGDEASPLRLSSVASKGNKCFELRNVCEMAQNCALRLITLMIYHPVILNRKQRCKLSPSFHQKF